MLEMVGLIIVCFLSPLVEGIRKTANISYHINLPSNQDSADSHFRVDMMSIISKQDGYIAIV